MTDGPSPLRPPVFHILLALAAEPRHGLGIADTIADTTENSVVLGPGTLYRSLKEMAGDGLIEDAPAPTDDGDPRRRYYAITARGQEAVRAEAARLSRIVDAAREAHVLPDAP